jgi:hypothetical protein
VIRGGRRFSDKIVRHQTSRNEALAFGRRAHDF